MGEVTANLTDIKGDGDEFGGCALKAVRLIEGELPCADH
jgi:hypothetical protein